MTAALTAFSTQVLPWAVAVFAGCSATLLGVMVVIRLTRLGRSGL